MRKLTTVLLSVTLAATPAAAKADDTYKQLMWEYEQKQKAERENGYPNSGYSKPECGWVCTTIGVVVLGGVIAAAMAEGDRKQRLQQQQRVAD